MLYDILLKLSEVCLSDKYNINKNGSQIVPV